MVNFSFASFAGVSRRTESCFLMFPQRVQDRMVIPPIAKKSRSQRSERLEIQRMLRNAYSHRFQRTSEGTLNRIYVRDSSTRVSLDSIRGASWIPRIIPSL